MFDNHTEVPQFIRVGKVSSVNRNNCTARVFFEDRDDVVSHDLRVIVKNTMNKKDYWLPDVDEQVVCIFLPNGEETGFIVGSVYSDVDRPPAEISNAGEERIGYWIDENNYIKWVAEERKFVVKSENPIEWVVG
ncbi:hypothetical protein [Lysinibacillus telephonicus]|uniref:hypothetical protein n=1 Tax=Lysinibacillus telephonicus TaxID=1714840 RepID=UPI003BA2ECF1